MMKTAISIINYKKRFHSKSINYRLVHTGKKVHNNLQSTLHFFQLQLHSNQSKLYKAFETDSMY